MLSRLENTVNNTLQKFPQLKKNIKRIYQTGMYAMSPKIKSEGNIIRVSPDDEYEYFFGYYDKTPWDITERYMLCLKVKTTYKEVAPKEAAEIILIDTHDQYKQRVINQTNAWNVQQGCMLQWLGTENCYEIIFNDFRRGEFCSIIYNIKSNTERVIKKPIYDVSKDGKIGVSLDFSRLHTLRPGYGYGNRKDKTNNILVPEGPAIWVVNLLNNTYSPLIDYADLYNFEHREDMKGAMHAVNHIMINPSGNRIMFLHRWLKNNKKYTRLITINIDGTEMYNLNNDDMTSHSFWKDDSRILTFANKNKFGNGYYLLYDKSQKFDRVLMDLTTDGHPSYSPDGKMIVTDSYPNRARVQSVYLVKGNEINTVARVHAPFRYDNDVRCDLHPRWNRSNSKIAFDSVFEGKRRLYVIKINGEMNKNG